jgi:hypothetical protein
MRPAEPDPTFPPSARVVTASLGVMFLVLSAVVAWTMGEPDWRPIAGAVALLILGLDMVLAALRRRWPLIAPLLFLP